MDLQGDVKSWAELLKAITGLTKSVSLGSSCKFWPADHPPDYLKPRNTITITIEIIIITNHHRHNHHSKPAERFDQQITHLIICNLVTCNTFIVIIEFIIIQIIIEIITAIIISKNIIIISNIIITTRQQLKVLTGRSPSRLLVTCQRSRLHRGQTSSFLNAFSNTNTEKYIYV